MVCPHTGEKYASFLEQLNLENSFCYQFYAVILSPLLLDISSEICSLNTLILAYFEELDIFIYKQITVDCGGKSNQLFVQRNMTYVLV